MCSSSRDKFSPLLNNMDDYYFHPIPSHLTSLNPTQPNLKKLKNYKCKPYPFNLPLILLYLVHTQKEEAPQCVTSQVWDKGKQTGKIKEDLQT
jgi:hypothetical protein